MSILALLAVFTADAADGSGSAFAVVYATFVVVMTWLWYTVRDQDRRDQQDFLPVTGRYVTGMAVSAAVILGSSFLPLELRLMVWAGFGTTWVVGLLLVGRSRDGLNLATTLTAAVTTVTLVALTTAPIRRSSEATGRTLARSSAHLPVS